ncbi:MAG: YabP/YqfC family sporulation protein [Bacillota bacterium]
MDLLYEKFRNLFDLPGEVIEDLPLLLLVGSGKLYLENHKGIATYQQQKIKIRIKKGYLIIEGQKLEVDEIKTNNLFISGSMEKLFFDLR